MVLWRRRSHRNSWTDDPDCSKECGVHLHNKGGAHRSLWYLISQEGQYMKEVPRFLTDEQGATSVEYAVLSALIVLAIVGSVVLLGGKVKDLFEAVSSQVW